jgi:hypothetical protein
MKEAAMTAQRKPKPTKPDAIALMAAMRPATPQVKSPPSLVLRPPAERSSATKPKPGARAGTRQIAGHFAVDTLKALKHIMAEEDTTLQALLDEAIRDLLVKKGRLKLVGA